MDQILAFFLFEELLIKRDIYTRKVIERRALKISYKDIIRFYQDLQSLPLRWRYENIIFLDEVGLDNCEMIRKRSNPNGYARKGSRIIYRGGDEMFAPVLPWC